MGIFFDLFLTFTKIGCFTFGGGYAMISMIENYCVEKKKWISHDEMMNITVIAESTPGPIAINCATFVGYQQAGLRGALIATLGIVLPAFLIIYIISLFFGDFIQLTIVANAFKGIKIAVGLLIFDAGITMMKKMQKKIIPVSIMICSFIASILPLGFSSLSIMVIAAIASLFVFGITGKSSQKGGAAK